MIFSEALFKSTSSISRVAVAAAATLFLLLQRNIYRANDIKLNLVRLKLTDDSIPIR